MMSVLGGKALDKVRRLFPAPRDALRSALAHFPVVLASVMVALTVTHPTDADPPTERGFRLASRKGPRVAAPAEEDAGEGSEIETLATLYNIHTGEAMPLSSSEPEQARFSEALADRITASRIDLDPRLLGLLREIARRNPGGRIELVSGYRSTKLNEMLRKKGHNVASKSQHSLGHAVDFRIVGMTPAEMKQEVLKLGWEGGIGRYDKLTDWFVHADVGPKRQWYEGR
jgi:uncharacterized protein YcbK (DUF882 family)